MAEDREQFERRLFSTFVKEARAHLEAMAGLLAALEREPVRADLLAELLRRVHSMKGAADAVEQQQAALVCRALEQAVHKARRGECLADAGFFSLMRQGSQALETGLASVADGGSFTIPLQFLESMRKLT